MSKLGKTVNKIFEVLKDAKERKDETRKNAAVKELYDLTYENLRIVARVYLNDLEEDRACIANAYEKMYAYIHAYSAKKDGYNWLCKIVQSCAYDINKKAAPHVALDEITDFVADPASMDDYLEKQELHRALQTLTKDEQKIVKYHFFQDLSMDVIARKMHLAKSTVFYRLQNIVDKLREIL